MGSLVGVAETVAVNVAAAAGSPVGWAGKVQAAVSSKINKVAGVVFDGTNLRAASSTF
jgi:hypothetical protein